MPESKIKEITKVKEKIKISPPKQYKIILLNNDYTPFHFVVHVIMQVFNKSNREAMAIMEKAHFEGKAICGIFPKEIAELKVDQVMKFANDHNDPLVATLEEDK